MDILFFYLAGYFPNSYGRILRILVLGRPICLFGCEIDRTGKVTRGDSFSYPAAPINLKNSKAVPTL